MRGELPSGGMVGSASTSVAPTSFATSTPDLPIQQHLIQLMNRQGENEFM